VVSWFKMLEEVLTYEDYEYNYKPKRGYTDWDILHYRGNVIKTFDNDEVEEIRISSPVTTGIQTCTLKIDNIPRKDIIEEDIFVVYIGYTDTGLKKKFSGIASKVRRQTKPPDEWLIVECNSWGKILLDAKVSEIKYINQEVSDIVKDLVKDVSTPSPTISERKISTGGVENIGVTLDVSFNDGETVWDCLKELADMTECDFYVDADKVLHFYKKGTRRSHLMLEDGELHSWYPTAIDTSPKVGLGLKIEADVYVT